MKIALLMIQQNKHVNTLTDFHFESIISYKFCMLVHEKMKLLRAMNSMELFQNIHPNFQRECQQDVLGPLDTLCRDVLPEIKQTYWPRNADSSGDQATIPHFSQRRILNEREHLRELLSTEVTESAKAFLINQQKFLHDCNHNIVSVLDIVSSFANDEEVQAPERESGNSEMTINEENHIDEIAPGTPEADCDIDISEKPPHIDADESNRAISSQEKVKLNYLNM